MIDLMLFKNYMIYINIKITNMKLYLLPDIFLINIYKL